MVECVAYIEWYQYVEVVGACGIISDMLYSQ